MSGDKKNKQSSGDKVRDFLDLLRIETSDFSKKSQHKPVFTEAKNSTPIDEKIRDEEARNKRIENDNKEKDQRLKERTLKILFWFLSIETALIFIFAFFQGFKTGGFMLDEWSFRLVLAGTLGQITAMLTIAVRHLFPKK